MRIDIHSHLTNRDLLKHLQGRSSFPNAVLESGVYFTQCSAAFRQPLTQRNYDLDMKLRDMEESGVDVAVLSHGIPGPELLGGGEADAWASRINDHLATVVQKHPDKFVGWGSIGFGDTQCSIAEVDRCINQLGFKGIQLFSNIKQRVLDSPEFMDVYKYVASLGVPMNMHPTAPLNTVGMEHTSLIPGMGFMYDTSLAAVRLIRSGLFDQTPELKLIVPHVGGILPYLSGRVGSAVDRAAAEGQSPRLAHPFGDYLDALYVDTIGHSPQALEWCYRMVGAESMLYGTDHPFGNYLQVANLVEGLQCTPEEREMIYHGNAERLLDLP